MKYLKVSVLSQSDRIDCTNNGVSVTHADKLVIECATGNITEQDVLERGYVVLKAVVKQIGPNKHYSFKPMMDLRWATFGGNFIYTNDSRFPFDQPVAIHDRYEG